ncbi:spore germination protein [Caloramator fervidus]|uniref:Spore germination protein n=1 Tax=Caloramator fervidus TaxID=29344 RepID=A0A1H5RK24_9CLOT|nr:Ger(x)C family spore germination protein [Caloramator fervidus]SEF38723.1 spore germination protein [Caloramator fervidus]
MKRLMFVFLAMLIFAGCWDKIEIEDRIFVYGIAIDKVSNELNKSKGPFYEYVNENIEVTFLIPNPSKVVSGEQNVFENITVRAGSIPEAIEKVFKKQNRHLFFGHEKLLILGEAVLRDDKILKEIVDWIDRDPQKNRSSFVVATKDVKGIINITPKLEKLLVPYIIGTLKNQEEVSTLLNIDFNGFVSNFKVNGVAILPIINKVKDEGVIKNVFLIKDYKLLKEVDDRYIRGYSILTNSLKGGRKLFKYKDHVLSYLISNSHASLEAKEEDGKINFNVKVKMEGDIEDFILNEDLLKADIVHNIEKSIKEQFENELYETVRYFQDTGYDYLKLKDWTKKHQYSLYKKYEKNWDEAFKTAKFNFDFEVKIRRVGVVR